jgi:hypothetical protein
MLWRLYHTRFSEQIETADAATIVAVAVMSTNLLIDRSSDGGTNTHAPCSA